MKFLNRLERKFGKYAIHDLMRYILGLYVVGTVLDMFVPNFYYNFLSLDFSMVAKGQIWRLITFIMAPGNSGTGVLSLFFLIIEVYLYEMIGSTLEQTWGTFRFNLYIISGILFNIIAAFVLYLVYGQMFGLSIPYTSGLNYIFQSMFLAFAFLYPDVQLLFAMVIPVKIKYLGYLYAIILAVEIFNCFHLGFTTRGTATSLAAYAQGISMIIAVANFLLFVLWAWKAKKPSIQQIKRRREFKKQVRSMASAEGEPRHRCAICGRTEQDNPNLEFRFCSKCEGNYEYCSDHLFSHTHVKKGTFH